MTLAEEMQKEAHGIAYGKGMWFGSKVTEFHTWWCELERRQDTGNVVDDAITLAHIPMEELEPLVARWQIEKEET